MSERVVRPGDLCLICGKVKKSHERRCRSAAFVNGKISRCPVVLPIGETKCPTHR